MPSADPAKPTSLPGPAPDPSGLSGPPGSVGLSALATLLPGNKGMLARRLIAAGHQPGATEFDRAGLTLKAHELAIFQDWLANGMATAEREQVCSADGTIKLRLELRDGRQVETVAMRVGAVCVSTQVGCAVGCRFCASGMFGVERNLTTDEIVEQVVHARRLMRIDRVVYMGMGEPSHNLDAVLEAVQRIKDEVLISPRRQTLSTVGGVKVFERMAAAPVNPCLALSLHLADYDRRRELLPRAHKDPLPELVAAADAYGRGMRSPVQFEWTLLAGVNDGDRDIDQLCELLQGVRGYINFIVYNRVEELPFRAPTRERIIEIVRRVKASGLLASIRNSSGPDAQAACGQLRLRTRVASLGADS